MPGQLSDKQQADTAVAQFAACYGALPVPALLLTSDGVAHGYNAAAAEVLGQPVAESPPQQMSDLCDLTDAAFARQWDAFKKGSRADPHVFSLGSTSPEKWCLQLVPFDRGSSASEWAVGLLLVSQTQTSEETGEARFDLNSAAAEAGGVALWSYCPKTEETWFSDTWYRTLGYAPGAFEPSFEVFLDLMHPDDHAQTLTAFERLRSGQSDFYRSDFRLRDIDGSWRWFGASGGKVSRSGSGLPDLICGVQKDITWRKETEASLASAAQAAVEHRNRLDHLAENSPAGLFEFRITSSGEVDFPYISQGVLDLLGVTQDEVDEDGSVCFRYILPEYLEPLNEAIGVSMADLSPFRFRYRLNHPSDGVVWIQVNSVPSRLEDGSTTWHGSLYDVTPEVRKEADLQKARDQALQMQKQMEELALHDVLTGLPNRRFFDMRLAQQRATALRGTGGGQLTLIRVDLDYFKYVNDNLGHDAGDAVLKHVADVLRSGFREVDFVSRIGGDEFSVILGGGASSQAAHKLVERIQKKLREPFYYGDQVCRFGASFGIATCDADSVSEGELHAFADAALYQAKQKGRNRVEKFTRSLHNHILENRRVTVEIEEALERGEFVPFFQPQVCARSRQLVGLETLARWQHPEKGMLVPEEFLDVAEQIRVVPMIDQMMLDRSRDILKRWRHEGFIPPKISFNVSSGRLRDPAILQAALGMQTDGTQVSFELLESILVEDESDEFRFNLDALKDSGIQIEIDDFGSGHASIIGVMEAQPSVLKIDKRLTRNVVSNPQSRELIAAIVRIAAALGISTTVEGVETQKQATVLTDLGCDVLQGFLYARPMDELQMLEYVKSIEVSSA